MYFLLQDPSIPEQTGLKSEIVSNFSCFYQEDTREFIELESESNIVLKKKKIYISKSTLQLFITCTDGQEAVRGDRRMWPPIEYLS